MAVHCRHASVFCAFSHTMHISYPVGWGALAPSPHGPTLPRWRPLCRSGPQTGRRTPSCSLEQIEKVTTCIRSKRNGKNIYRDKSEARICKAHLSAIRAYRPSRDVPNPQRSRPLGRSGRQTFLRNRTCNLTRINKDVTK